MLDQNDLNALKDSTFGKMGMETLLGQLDSVTNLVTEMDSKTLETALSNDAFLISMANTLGIKTEGVSKDVWLHQLTEKRDALAKEWCIENNKDPNNADDLKAGRSKVMANAAVFYTAQQTDNMNNSNPQKIQDLLNTSNKATIIANMQDPNKSGDGMAQAALMCALYTAYVNTPDYTGDKTVDVITVVNALDDPDFLDFIKNDPQAQKDINGYLGSMSIINDSSQDVDAVEKLLVNGFADSDLINEMDKNTKN